MIQKKKKKSLLGERRGSEGSPHSLRSGVLKALEAEEGKALFPSHLELAEGQVDRRQVGHRKPLWDRSGTLAWMCFSRAVGLWC